jgi:hypothetical protein
VRVALALRNWLFWITGSSGPGAGAARLTTLLVVVATTVFVAVFTGETIARAHPLDTAS